MNTINIYDSTNIKTIEVNLNKINGNTFKITKDKNINPHIILSKKKSAKECFPENECISIQKHNKEEIAIIESSNFNNICSIIMQKLRNTIVNNNDIENFINNKTYRQISKLYDYKIPTLIYNSRNLDILEVVIKSIPKKKISTTIINSNQSKQDTVRLLKKAKNGLIYIRDIHIFDEERQQILYNYIYEQKKKKENENYLICESQESLSTKVKNKTFLYSLYLLITSLNLDVDNDLILSDKNARIHIHDIIAARSTNCNKLTSNEREMVEIYDACNINEYINMVLFMHQDKQKAIDYLNGTNNETKGLNLKLQEFDYIIEALEEHKGSRKNAAEKLGISERCLRNKISNMKQEGIIIPDKKGNHGK